MGLIAKAIPGRADWSKSVAFYLQIDSLAATPEQVKANGGAIVIMPMAVKAEGFDSWPCMAKYHRMYEKLDTVC